MRPVLLLEINEVPLRVWKHFAEDHRFPHVARLLRESAMVETKLSDPGELSPWCTWPTFHRGISKDEHGIHNLGQDPATFRGTPIWEEFRKRGMPIGIFGSLQSWPPADPGAGGFYLPDTFATDERCIPAYLEPLQAFNLAQVRANGRMMSKTAVARPPGPALLAAMIKAGVRPSTLVRIGGQLVAERFDKKYRERRVTFQALLFWDVFRNLFDPDRPPAFTTFFTNHIASVMHRYWSHIFPGDFPADKRPAETVHLATMDFAIHALDRILADAFAWRERNPNLILLVANCMGQAAIVRDTHEGFELLLKEPLALLRRLGLGAGARQNLAMMPQVALDFAEARAAESAAAALRAVTSAGGAPLLRCDLRGNSLSITSLTPKAAEISDGVAIVNGVKVPLKDCGFEQAVVEAGTAYHIPEGQIFAHGLAETSRIPEKVEATAAKSLILHWAGL